jgi:hypothetical protein
MADSNKVPNSPASRMPQFKVGSKGGSESSADRANRRRKTSVIRKRIGDNDSGKAWLE